MSSRRSLLLCMVSAIVAIASPAIQAADPQPYIERIVGSTPGPKDRVTILAIGHSNSRATPEQHAWALRNFEQVSDYLGGLDTSKAQIVLIEGFSDAESVMSENLMFPAFEKHVDKPAFKFQSWDNFALLEVAKEVFFAADAKSVGEPQKNPIDLMKDKIQSNNQLYLMILLRSYFLAKKISELYAANPDANITVLCGAGHAFDGITEPELNKRQIPFRVLATDNLFKLAGAANAVMNASLKNEVMYSTVAAAIKDPSYTRDASVRAALDVLLSRAKQWSTAADADGAPSLTAYRWARQRQDSRSYLQDCESCECMLRGAGYLN